MQLRYLLFALFLPACTLQPTAIGDPAGTTTSGEQARLELQIGSATDALPRALSRVLDQDPLPEFMLFGEVHDHPLHHRLRYEWLSRIAASRRFAIAMEQFDEPRQSDLDAARARGDSPQELARAAGFRFDAWDWAYYEPFVRLALERGLPLFAANLSGEQARAIARGTAPGAAPPADWSKADQLAMQDEIDQGHCAMLPAAALAPMARAQLARDATMAAVMTRAHRESGLPVLLIAGNGHVRRDLGVPRHLPALVPGARIISIGLLERQVPAQPETVQNALAGRYHIRVLTPAHPRPDPCEMLKRFPRGAASGTTPAVRN
ncbi:MAG: ChaN family lipoprotein [Quisquiliibacterium sp.]